MASFWLTKLSLLGLGVREMGHGSNKDVPCERASHGRRNHAGNGHIDGHLREGPCGIRLSGVSGRLLPRAPARPGLSKH